MIKRTITYTNFNGEEKSKDCYFHLSKIKLAKLEASFPGGLANAIQSLQTNADPKLILEIFDTLIKTSYGEKSEDGETFIQNEALSEKFSYTEAFSQLFMELIENDEKASEFIKGIIPADMLK